MTEIEIPIMTVSEANVKEHWAVKAKRVKEQRTVARMFVRNCSSQTVNEIPFEKIILTRLAPRKLDSDNLASSLKAARDGIADALGINDGDDRITWEYRQGKRGKDYAVKVEIL